MAMKPKSVVTRELPQLSMRAAVAPASLDEEGRTFDVVWTTGERVMRGFFDSYWEELSLEPDHVHLERLNSGAPVLNAHRSYDLDDVIGVVESARLDEGQGIATLRLARDAKGDAILAKVKDGVLRHVSVGYRVGRLEKLEEEEGKVPVYRAVDWTPYEISMVPMGADSGASVRGSDAETNPCDFVAQETMMAKLTSPKTRAPAVPPPSVRAEDDKDDKDDEEEDEEEAERADDAEDQDEDKGDDDGDKRAAGIADLARRGERKRIASLQRLARVLGVPDETLRRHVERGTSVPKFRAIAQRIFESNDPPVARRGVVEAGEDVRDKWLRGAGDWLLVRSSRDRVVSESAKARGQTAKVDPGEFRGMSLLDLARQSLERAGVRTAGMSRMDIAGQAFVRAGGMHTTSDFAVLLEGTINRVLLAAYAVAPDTWREFAKVGSVSDFRPHTRLRQGAFSRLDKVNEHGEFKNKPIADGSAEEIAAETYGNIVGVSRQAIVNDDLGFLSDVAARLGRAAKLSIELAVYDLIKENSGLGPVMADSKTLFHDDHANISTGAALAVTALDADRLKMAAQTDPSGNEILDIRPSILLVPIGLEGQARVMTDAEFDIDAGDGVTPNRIRGLFPKIVGSPRITGTRRYVFADPDVAPTIEVVFLDGQQEPYLDQQEGWRIDGTEWKVRLDFGAGAVDWRGAVTNDGVSGE